MTGPSSLLIASITNRRRQIVLVRSSSGGILNSINLLSLGLYTFPMASNGNVAPRRASCYHSPPTTQVAGR